MSKRFVVKTTLPVSSAILKKLGVDPDGKVQQFVTDEIYKRLIPYIPFKTGNLRSMAEKRHRSIVVLDVYARAQFFGVTKEGKPFDYEPTGPKVGSHWDRRLKADEGRSIVAAANRFVRSRK